jgi:DNA-binding transcriptional LysR family regulator
VQNHLTVANMVANSNMIATLPNRLVRSFLTQFPLKILELPIRLPPVQNRIFWHERMQSDHASRWFRQLTADVAKTM